MIKYENHRNQPLNFVWSGKNSWRSTPPNSQPKPKKTQKQTETGHLYTQKKGNSNVKHRISQSKYKITADVCSKNLTVWWMMVERIDTTTTTKHFKGRECNGRDRHGKKEDRKAGRSSCLERGEMNEKRKKFAGGELAKKRRKPVGVAGRQEDTVQFVPWKKLNRWSLLLTHRKGNEMSGQRLQNSGSLVRRTTLVYFSSSSSSFRYNEQQSDFPPRNRNRKNSPVT